MMNRISGWLAAVVLSFLAVAGCATVRNNPGTCLQDMGGRWSGWVVTQQPANWFPWGTARNVEITGDAPQTVVIRFGLPTWMPQVESYRFAQYGECDFTYRFPMPGYALSEVELRFKNGVLTGRIYGDGSGLPINFQKRG